MFSQVFAVLFNRYLSFADVRYQTLRTLTRRATQRAVRSGSSSSNGASKATTKEQEQQQQQVANGGGAELDAEQGGDDDGDGCDADAGQLSGPDVARNVFDVLAAVPTTVAAAAGAGGAAAEDGEGLKSWCGAAEVRGDRISRRCDNAGTLEGGGGRGVVLGGGGDVTWKGGGGGVLASRGDVS